MANIGFDIDGTLTDYHGFVKSKIQDFFKKTNILLHYDAANYGGVIFPSAAIKKLFWSLYADEYFSLPVLQDAKETILQLKRKGHKIYYISKRKSSDWNKDKEKNFNICTTTLQWVMRNDLPFDGVVCTFGHSKLPWIKTWNIQFMLEDYAFSANTIPECRIYQLDREYNKNNNFGTRIKDVKEFEKAIC